jgi:hypothetical protein
MEQAIEGVIEAFRQQLGEDLVGVYLYGSKTQPYFQSGYSDINLLVVVSDDVDIFALRRAFFPVWRQHHDALGRPPAVARSSVVSRHLSLVPLLGQHFAEDARRLRGADDLPRPEHDPAPAAWFAYLARESLLGSIALAPGLLDQSLVAPAYRRLHRVARILAGAPFDGEPPAPVLFAHIQMQLRKLASTMSGDPEPDYIDDPKAPNLEGIYAETDRMVVLLPPLSESLLRSLDWPAIARRLATRHNLLQATTARQIVLIQHHETAVDFVLGRYRHVWGEAPLDSLTLPLRSVLETAGRVPSRLIVEGIGGDYLTAADEEALHILVHDYQNRLLNIRLQHELLHRAHGLEAASPPDPLPPRDATLAERVRGLSDHLDWWAAYYAAQLEKVETTEYVAAL